MRGSLSMNSMKTQTCDMATPFKSWVSEERLLYSLQVIVLKGTEQREAISSTIEAANWFSGMHWNMTELFSRRELAMKTKYRSVRGEIERRLYVPKYS